MNFPPKGIVDSIKKDYPVGSRVELDHMADSYRQLPVGTRGTVRAVDDIGTIHVNWDCGSSLGVAYGEDSCHRIEEE